MKKTVGLMLALVLAASLLMPVPAQALNSKRKPGGLPAFFIGCCFGIRAGTQWNEGSELHWREWSTIIPIVGLFVGIWNGVDCAGGMTAHQFDEQYGANWY